MEMGINVIFSCQMARARYLHCPSEIERLSVNTIRYSIKSNNPYDGRQCKKNQIQILL